MTACTRDHETEELCDAGAELYARALRDGPLSAEEARETPCPVDTGLLRPSLDDPGRLVPVPPTVALHRLLRFSGERVAAQRRREERLTEVFQQLIRIGEPCAEETGAPALSVLNGQERINGAIAEALAEGKTELLCIQPHSHYHTSEDARTAQAAAMVRDQEFLDRGGRIRVLYPHTQRHIPLVVARYEQLKGDAQARTLDEVAGRLIIIDGTVAYIPGDREAERSVALEIRHPAVITYLVNMFDRFWRLATPMHPQAVQPPSLNGITARQRAIARFLVEGHTDAVIADRLGMNVRTARVHIAKLASTLGSGSRAQLGYLIARSGILDREE
ncbi:helix-turn-helix transcriptional regulator [Streptomyces sp. M2CJ-2]|uniref:helix-turn-helix transcriptional regulator n=1 Tax=Streptomyces sp. M2CJ-2 TaxID=2803948 RepID=UPI001925A463|nr:LuxR C-terminal-related transcriptional regulator [Streptomyces sp. M2CJ-2]MBL3669017.1 helix-turn-helix transcriptional regulator [Streptomyces sp. M2CJ-2]